MSVHLDNLTSKAQHHVAEMDSHPGPTCGRGLFLAASPVICRHVEPTIVAPVSLHVDDRAELSGVGHPLDLFPGWLETPLVTDPHDDAGIVTGLHHVDGRLFG